MYARGRWALVWGRGGFEGGDVRGAGECVIAGFFIYCHRRVSAPGRGRVS